MDNKVDEYITKLASPQGEICKRLREIILRTFPGIKEEFKWGVPVYGGEKYYLGALKTHVNLGFSVKGLSKEEIALFQGSGKTMKHIKINSLKEMNEEYIVKLLKMVWERSK